MTTTSKKTVDNELSLLSANVNSINGKFSDICVITDTIKPSIFCCQESKLSRDDCFNHLTIPSYIDFHSPRTANGGGLSIYCLSSLNPTIHKLDLPLNSNIELMCVKFISGSVTYGVLNVYRSPALCPIPDFIDSLSTCISDIIDSFDNLFVVGDFNICMLNDIHSCRNLFNMLSSNFDLIQLVSDYTHKSRIIDHIYVPRSLAATSTIKLLPPIEKHHHALSLTVKQPIPVSSVQSFVKFDFSNADWFSLNNFLCSVNITDFVTRNSNIDHIIQIIISFLLYACVLYIPLKTIKINPKFPWMNDDVRRKKRAQYRAHRCYKKSTDPHIKSHHYSRYIKLCKQYRKSVAKAKSQYISNNFSSFNNISKFWRSFNKSLGRNSSKIHNLILNNGTVIIDPVSISRHLSNHFCSVFSPADVHNFDSSPFVHNDTLPFLVDVDFVRSKISLIDCNKSAGSDYLSPRIVKSCSFALAPVITSIINKCVRSCYFPDVLKHAIVTPIPKIKSSFNICDFRPVSVLTVFDKIFELHLYSLLQPYIFNRLSSSQYGFRPRLGTTDCLYNVVNIISFYLNSHSAVSLTCFDLSKAFDTVSHFLLLNSLRDFYRVPGPLLNIIKSYLTNRTQSVRIGSVLSDPAPVTSGVPQGSVLGPLLFISFINSISDCVLSAGSHLFLYADDIALVHPIKNAASFVDINSDCTILASHVTDVLKLKLNVSKTISLICERNKSRPIYTNQSYITLNNIPVANLSVIKYLGVYIDKFLTFSHNNSTRILTVRRSIAAFSRTFRSSVPSNVMRYIFISLYKSVLMYAITVTYPTNVKCRAKLESLNRYLCRLITNKFDYTLSYDHLLSEANFKSIAQEVFVLRVCYLHSVIFKSKYMHPVLIDNFIKFRSAVSSRSVSRSYSHGFQLYPPMFKYEVSMMSSLYLSVLAFNVLPCDVFVSTSFRASVNSRDVLVFVINHSDSKHLIVLSTDC